MKLPSQTKPIERKTYNASAAAVGANASAALNKMMNNVLYGGATGLY